MSIAKTDFTIALIDDCTFYNALMTKQLLSYTGEMAADSSLEFQIASYTHVDDFLRNINSSVDIAIVDHHLDGNNTGLSLINKIILKSKDCKVLMLTQARSEILETEAFAEGAAEFINKQEHDALIRACYFVEEVIAEKSSH